jgi:hypothetical protein
MPKSQHISSVVAIERPTCPKCRASMRLASITPVRAGVDLHSFECAICNHALETLTAHEDPMKSHGYWLQGDLNPPK